MTEMKIYQEVELSLTENLIPAVVHVKQFDHRARKVRCLLYTNSVSYTIPDGVIISCTGTRPDGYLFQYSNETAPELVCVEDNAVVFTITDFMTEVSGRFPVDVNLLDDEGDVLGTFSLTLHVERSAVGNGKIAAITYEKAAEAVANGVQGCYITEDGYFGIQSEDGLNLTEGSVSSTVDKIKEELVEASINGGGYLEFDTDASLGLAFGMDGEGRLTVDYGEEDM